MHNGFAKTINSQKGLIQFIILFILLAFGIGFCINMFSKNNQSSIQTINNKTTCNISKKDGTYETERCNDLEELCKDWLFFRRKILEANRAGDIKAVNKYRNSFQKVTTWMNQYRESDVTATMSRVDTN